MAKRTKAFKRGNTSDRGRDDLGSGPLGDPKACRSVTALLRRVNVQSLCGSVALLIGFGMGTLSPSNARTDIEVP